jgi:CheY-like chemotaxis protein
MSSISEKPTVIAFVSDLMFISRISAVLEALGWEAIWIGHGQQITPNDLESPIPQLGEQLSGPGVILLDMLSRRQPNLLIFDLGNSRIPWREWLPMIKTSPSTRRIPVISYGSHIDGLTLSKAKSSGSDVVVARSQFVEDMRDLFIKTARIIDQEAIEAT